MRARPAVPALTTPAATVAPDDRYAGKCPYRLVDPAPHHYRIQASRWDTKPWPHLRSVDCHADTAEDAERLRSHYAARGFEHVSVLPPQCDGTEHYDRPPGGPRQTVQLRYVAPDGTVIPAEVAGPLVAMPPVGRSPKGAQ